MSAENEMVIKKIVGSIRKLFRAVYLDAAKMSRGFGLTGSQSGVLRAIFKHGPLSSANLSRRMFVTPSNITGIIDRLEKKGLVERIRRREDRRIVLITLTEKGEQVSRLIPDPIEKKLISGLADLNPAKVRQLEKAMNQILNLIDAGEFADVPLELNPATASVSDDRDQGISHGSK